MPTSSTSLSSSSSSAQTRSTYTEFAESKVPGAPKHHEFVPLVTWRDHTEAALCMDFTHDSSLVASGSMDSTVRLWRYPQRHCITALLGHAAAVTNVAFTANARFLLSASEYCTIRAWSIDEHRLPMPLHTLRVGGPVTALSTSPWGRLAVCGLSESDELLALDLPMEYAEPTRAQSLALFKLLDPHMHAIPPAAVRIVASYVAVSDCVAWISDSSA
eukprot:TRINITY_DN65950_c0_g1_i1.p1 TRINITY_DN65950_c0_g1~~TRINITY_DN65950_c0_g1_i1.p1  ORF type:complete len:217 (-),score=87.29 TRINITY_DN65950_c0_g1_i1:17-667(-)